MIICVYGAASDDIDSSYIAATEELGKKMAERGHSLVFGAGRNGLMGAVARGVSEIGGQIIGVIPTFFEENDVEIVSKQCTKVIHTETMRERKQIMEEHADAFIMVPGGIGTFEEFYEILTAKQLKLHDKPIAVYNVNSYYDEMQTMIETAIKKGFIKPACRTLYKIFNFPDDMLDYIETDKGNDYTISDLKT